MLTKMSHAKSCGMILTGVIDIGSYHGYFGDMVTHVWPDCRVISIEADARHATVNPDQITACLSDQNDRLVKFYSLERDKISTGASYYREQTIHYQNPTVSIMKTITFDSLSSEIDLDADWCNHGLIKIDTQGSELDILKGANIFLQEKKVKWLLIETSHQCYNQHAPCSSEVVSWLWQQGYAWKDVWDLVADNSGLLLQSDLLFERQS